MPRYSSQGDISAHIIGDSWSAHCPHMTTEQFRELCEQVLMPQVMRAIEQHLIDIHDVIDISSNELMRIGDRLDDIDVHLAMADREGE
jgi:hypothetical protein